MVSPKSYKMGQVTTYKNWDSYLIFLLLDLNPIFFFWILLMLAQDNVFKVQGNEWFGIYSVSTVT